MKKTSPWLWIGCGVLLLVGIVGLLVGVFIPGSPNFGELASNAATSPSADTKKKADGVLQQLKSHLERPAFPGTNSLDHRVFVSRTLLFLPKEKESVQALRNDLVTSDGINVGWKIKHGFDLEDPNVASQDDDQDGFSNKEEFDKGTDPNDAGSSPSRWVKIKIASVETNMLTVGFSGKSGDRYTLRLQGTGKKKDVDVVVGEQLWLASTSKGMEVYKSDAEQGKAKDAGLFPHAIPIAIKKYHEDKGSRMDEKTKTENDYDDSYLEVERGDALGGGYKILIDERGKCRGVVWSVGDIRLFSLVPGEGEMGPYRVGQTFSYAGKIFLVQDAATNKVTLLMKPEGEEVQILPKTP